MGARARRHGPAPRRRRATAALRDIDRVAALWPQDAGLFRSDRDRALGWLAAERQGLAARPGRSCIAGAANARARGAFALEAMLLHDVVRFGDAAAVVDRLVELADVVQGPLVRARAEHAAGIVAGDIDALATRGQPRSSALGSPLLAAEAALDLADAADVAARRGTPPRRPTDRRKRLDRPARRPGRHRRRWISRVR